VQFGQKRNACKVEANEGMVTKEISDIKKKLSTLYRNNGKDTLRASQESAKSYFGYQFSVSVPFLSL
jgi:DNA replication protein DnaD